MGLKKGKASLVPAFLNEGNDTLRIKASIRKVASLEGVENVFTSHYGYSNNYKKTFEEWSSPADEQ